LLDIFRLFGYGVAAKAIFCLISRHPQPLPRYHTAIKTLLHSPTSKPAVRAVGWLHGPESITVRATFDHGSATSWLPVNASACESDLGSIQTEGPQWSIEPFTVFWYILPSH